jgi:hypothetical protein
VRKHISDCLSAIVPDDTTTQSDSQSPVPIAAQIAPVVEQQPKTKETYEREQQNRIQQPQQLTTSLMSAEIAAEFKQIEREFHTVLRSGMNKRDQANLDVLRSGLKYGVFILSDPGLQTDSKRFNEGKRNAAAIAFGRGNTGRDT